MTAKRAQQPQPGSSYTPDELEPRDWAAEDAFADGFIERNRETVNRALEAGERSLEAGAPRSLDEVLGEIEARKRIRQG